VPHPLDGPLAKLRRAEEHLKAFRSAVDQFLATKPYRTVLEIDTETAQKVVWVEFPAASIDDGILAGDFTHNLRSCLDHLAWQFAALKGKPGKECQFPIFANPSEFKRHGRRMIRQVRVPDARALIQEVQPYNEGAVMWLRVGLRTINEMSNIDKHRVMVRTIVSPRAIGTMTNEVQVFFGPHEGKAKLAVGPLSASDDDMKVEVHPDLILDLRPYVPITYHSAVRDLETCLKAVWTVIRMTEDRGIFSPHPTRDAFMVGYRSGLRGVHP
jgi:hypothetical protein